jgi:hypothetical protein
MFVADSHLRKMENSLIGRLIHEKNQESKKNGHTFKWEGERK